VISQKPNPKRLATVFENIDASLVLIARDALKSAKIESFVLDANPSSILARVRLLVPARLMVYADVADQARECLRELGIDK
jgi:arginine deiminase